MIGHDDELLILAAAALATEDNPRGSADLATIIDTLNRYRFPDQPVYDAARVERMIARLSPIYRDADGNVRLNADQRNMVRWARLIDRLQNGPE